MTWSSLAEIRKTYDEEKCIEEHKIDEQTLKAIANKHPDVIGWVDIDLLVPILSSVKELPEGLDEAAKVYQKEAKRFKSVLSFYNEIISCKKEESFHDVEVHKWALQYLDKGDVEESVNGALNEKGDLDIELLLAMIEEDIEEEDEQEGYLLLLRGDVYAELTLKEIEAEINERLSPIKDSISAKTCFATLVL